jgi:hypothetical protein
LVQLAKSKQQEFAVTTDSKTNEIQRPRFIPALLAIMGALAALPAIQAAPVFTPGQLKVETFNNATRAQINSGAVTAPSAVEYVPSFSFADLGADNYARRVTGFFIPPASGNYVFFINSDDDSDLFLSTDADPANKRLIAQETAWSAALSWNASAGGSNLDQKRSDRFSPPGTTNKPFADGIALVAGTRYYIEGVQTEGTGGDNFAVTFKLVGELDPEDGIDTALLGEVIGMNVPDSPVFLAHPVNRRVAPGTSVTLSAVVEPLDATLQWFRDGTAIDGEVNPTHVTPELTATATYHVAATLGASTVQSSNAVITIGALVPVPNTVRREYWADDLITRDEVNDPSFATPPDTVDQLPTFETPTNFSDNYVHRVSGLFVPQITGNYVFFIAADDQGDLFLSTDATPANKRLIAQETGWSGVRNWNGVGAPGADLTAAQAIALKRSDGFIPNPLNDPGAVPPFTNGIALTAGTSYYIEAVQEDGAGGDNLAVTFKLVGEPDPVNGSGPRIDSTVLGTYPLNVALDGAILNITQQPLSTNGLQNRTVTLTLAATSDYEDDDSSAAPPIIYQWQTAAPGTTTWTNIVGANGVSYTTPSLALAESGRSYRVVVRASDATVNTEAAVVTVDPDVVAPRPVTVGGVNAARTVVTLSFDEVLDAPSAQIGANYSFAPGGISGMTAVLANGSNLTVTAASPLTADVENTLTITGVRDLAGNAVAANTTIKFTFNLVTYAANILFDEPIAFYRFEETSGSVATNSGSVGGDGIYSEGDEVATGEGGIPGTAKGDPGPRPPGFAGFDADNRGATFDGIDDWVDTRNQYLQNRSAFTLEYWVKPVNRTNEIDGTVWPGRVALVGQNDAIEYGFITPGTIQIWTAGGGSLDTAYSFPDDEWHHVATIADGTAIRNYFDGALVGTGGTATASYGSSTFNVHIGGAGGFDAAGNWFTGQMDEVAIFDRAISADRVAAHFRAGREGGVITVSGEVTPGGPTEGTTLTASRSGTTMTINWAPTGGTLESTPSLGTPNWTDVGAENPATITIGPNHQFFRVRR